MVFQKQDNNEGFFGLVFWCGECTLRGLEKEADFPKICYLICKKITDLLKIKIALCQGNYRPRV